MKQEKIFKIECQNNGGFMSNRPTRYHYHTGTLKELIKCFSYTLDCGRSYQHEKGNKKINIEPKNIKSLISNLNNAVNNSAANGYSGKYYMEVLLDYEEKK